MYAAITPPAEPVAPMEPSPYLPTTRRFQNPMYLRVERIGEYADLDEAARRSVDGLRKQIHQELDTLDRIDRDAAWAAKRAALRLVHAVPRSAGSTGSPMRRRRLALTVVDVEVVAGSLEGDGDAFAVGSTTVPSLRMVGSLLGTLPLGSTDLLGARRDIGYYRAGGGNGCVGKCCTDERSRNQKQNTPQPCT